jgi:hypothetical protein
MAAPAIVLHNRMTKGQAKTSPSKASASAADYIAQLQMHKNRILAVIQQSN